MGINWTCPFCHRDQVITDAQHDQDTARIHIEKHKFGSVGYSITSIGCANPHCQEIELEVWFGPGKQRASATGGAIYVLDEDQTERFRLRPTSSARMQPASVPQVLATDYYEACAIRDLSPKASATLSRRVLQGMIRDFCKISKGQLIQEIDALKTLADAGTAPQGVAVETIAAMHHVRSIGNIGAHMEKDINVIVDVDPNEAQALIELIEMLFKDWYVARAAREEQLANLKKIADAKTNQKKPAAAP